MALEELELTHVRGDSEDYVIPITDEDGTPVDLTKSVDGTSSRFAITRFAVKDDPAEESNDQALVFKRSYRADEIEYPVTTTVHVIIDKPDTQDAEVKTYKWDLEITRQDFLRTAAGTITVAVDSIAVVGSGTAFQKAKVGDVLQPLGVTNTKPVKITKITSDTALEVEYPIFVAEAGITFEIRRGRSHTARKGDFVITQDVVAR